MIDVAREIRDAAETKLRCLAIAAEIEHAGQLIVAAVRRGAKVLVCGNGGSAADAQHFVAELVGRFERDRRGVCALALTTDSSILTAVANDSGYEQIFARQVQAIAAPGDILVVISTSGDSANVVAALAAAGTLGLERIALLGGSGGLIGRTAGVTAVRVPSDRTCRIQEAHGMVLHIWAQLIDDALT